MNLIREALQKLNTLDESKQDQQKFIDKFGQDVFNQFNKAKQRLKNNNISTDILWHVKNTSEEEMKELLLSLYDDEKDSQKKRIIKGEDKEIRGQYKYLGEVGGYKIYEPLDYVASMDLGVNTGWCTTGRYGHAGHPEFTPSEQAAEHHFNSYTSRGIRLFYFLNPNTMYGEYAVALYPETIHPNIFYPDNNGNQLLIKDTNFELFNAQDKLDYTSVNKLPLDKLPVETELNVVEINKPDESADIVYTYDGTPIPQDIREKIKEIRLVDNYNVVITIKNSKGKWSEYIGIPNFAFKGCLNLQIITLPITIEAIGYKAFDGCPFVKIVTPKHRMTVLSPDASFLASHVQYSN